MVVFWKGDNADPIIALTLLWPAETRAAPLNFPLIGAAWQLRVLQLLQVRGCPPCHDNSVHVLLQGQADRVNYLMTKQAKVVAMTCTHAALKRHEFLELGFKFDNLLMEESAQILEIETFIPMLLQVCLPSLHLNSTVYLIIVF